MKDATVKTYLAASKIHWPARQHALLNVLQALNRRDCRFRIVDIGCGPGLLVPEIRKLNFDYLGVDTDHSIINYCREKFAGRRDLAFSSEDISWFDGAFNELDIVVLNGVIHHLRDEQVARMLNAMKNVTHMIILDHYRPVARMSFERFIPFVLQNLDNGKYVRQYDWYNELANFDITDRQIFPIKVMGVKLWDYFCHAYQKK